MARGRELAMQAGGCELDFWYCLTCSVYSVSTIICDFCICECNQKCASANIEVFNATEHRNQGHGTPHYPVPAVIMKEGKRANELWSAEGIGAEIMYT